MIQTHNRRHVHRHRLARFFCICRHARDIRVHYEQKLERANSLYQELNECMQHLEAREKELLR